MTIIFRLVIEREAGVGTSHFWSALKEIAAAKNTSRPVLVAQSNNERQHANLSSAIRLFVLEYYRERVR